LDTSKGYFVTRLLFLPPNLITLSRPIAVSILCYFLIHDPRLVVDGYVGFFLFLFFYWVSDYLDGIVARKMGMTSNFGSKLDLFCDRICDFVIVFTVLIVHDLEYWFPMLVYMLGRLAPEFLYFLHSDQFRDSPLFKDWSDKAYKIYGEAFYFVRTVFFTLVLFSSPHWLVSAIFILSNIIFLFDGMLILKSFAAENKDAGKSF